MNQVNVSNDIRLRQTPFNYYFSISLSYQEPTVPVLFQSKIDVITEYARRFLQALSAHWTQHKEQTHCEQDGVHSACFPCCAIRSPPVSPPKPYCPHQRWCGVCSSTRTWCTSTSSCALMTVLVRGSPTGLKTITTQTSGGNRSLRYVSSTDV